MKIRSLVLFGLTLCGLLSVGDLSSSLPTENGEFWLRTESPSESEDESEGSRRAEWFSEQRAYPLASIPRGARSFAVAQLDREERRLRTTALRSTNATFLAADQAVWAPLGPMPIQNGQTYGLPRVAVSGRIAAITFDPRYDGASNQTVYVGSAQGGVWRSTENGANWVPITDGLPSLAIGAIAIDPTNPRLIYVGTGEGNRAGDTYYGAGLFKSADGGATWTQITGPVSTTDPKLPSFINSTFMRIEIDPSSPTTLYAATNVGLTGGASGGSGVAPLGNRGVWKSTDGALTWRNLNPVDDAIDRSATDVLLDPRNPRRVYAAILNVGIFQSEAGGEPGTWKKLEGGLPSPGNSADPAFRRIFLAAGPAMAPSTETTLYAAFGAGNDDLLGIWRTTDNGATWTKLINPQNQGQANYNLALGVDPRDAKTLYYGTSANSLNNGGTLWRSRDGGQTWTDLSGGNGKGGLHADTHAVVVSPANSNVVFTANDGGAWRTDNALGDGVGWQSLNDTLNITQFQSIALHPTNPNIVIGGTQDNGTNRYDGDVRWTHIQDGDSGFTLIDQSNPQVMYHTFFNQNNVDGARASMGPEISRDGGQSWARRGCFGCSAGAGRINPSDRVGFYAPLALHSGFTGTSGNVIYFGTHRLYRSADQGVTWTGLGVSTDTFGMDLTKGSGRVSAIAAHPKLDLALPTAGETVWAGTSDGLVQVTANAGALGAAVFLNVTKAPLPNRFITDIGLDPGNPRRAVVTYSGFNISTPATPGHVFLTNDLGATWTDISGNLPDAPATSVALDPADPNQIYLGTDLGVFLTADGGATWVRMGNGLPRVATFMVRYHAATKTLFAATHGRGIFQLVMARSLSTVSAASFKATGVASESIVASFGVRLATGNVVAQTQNLPTTLAGTQVAIKDSAGTERLAPLFFVSPGQVNYLIPSGTASGPATITITSADGSVAQGTAEVSAVAPSLFSANSDGFGIASGGVLRIASGGQTNEPIAMLDTSANRFVARPIDLGQESEQVFLVLFGTGVRFLSTLSDANATIGGTRVEVLYAGPQGNFVGLDQVNLRLPRSLAGKGEVDVVLLAEGKEANHVRVNIK